MGYLYVAVAALCWATLGPVARVAFEAGVTPLEVAFWRALLGGVLFGVHRGLFRSARLERRHVGPVVGFAVVGVGVFFGAYQLAVDAGGAALAAVLLYTAPAWVAVMSVLLLNERMTLLKLLALLLTLLGVVGVAWGGDGAARFSVAAIGWGLVSGVSYACYYPFGTWYFHERTPATWYAYAFPVGALLLLPFVTFADKPLTAWGALAWLAVVSTYVAYLAYGAALQRLEATRASIGATLEPVFAGALAFWWWSEQFGWMGYAGAALILAAVVLATMDPARIAVAAPPDQSGGRIRR